MPGWRWDALPLAAGELVLLAFGLGRERQAISLGKAGLVLHRVGHSAARVSASAAADSFAGRSAAGRSPSRARILSFCSCIWCTPDMITFQGELSGMCSIIRPIMRS